VYFRIHPNLAHLKLFGFRVCVRVSRIWCDKLNRHDIKGIFLGYTETGQKMFYLDLTTGVVKRSHHAQFDKAWYIQLSWPPAA
jgi:hypothetical protein